MRAVFLDRDGTIIKDKEYLSDLSGITIEKGAIEGIKIMNEAGFKVIIVTNQPHVARGFLSEEQVEKMNGTLVSMLEEKGAVVDGVYFCPHHPERNHPDIPQHVMKYRVECECRKPGVGMLKQAAREHGIDLENSFMIGDRTMDILAGKNAGCKTILVKTGMAGKDGKHEVKADHETDNLLHAANIIDGLLHTKVLLLAGGRGERLMPLTKDIPKPMVEIGGKPAMQHHIELVKKHGMKDVVICASHMAEKIIDYFGDGSKFGLNIFYPREPQQLGSGGAIKNAQPFLGGARHIVVLNGDVMTDIDISRLMDFHIKNGGIATMVVRYSDHPKDSDVVELQGERIVKYIGRGQQEKNIGNTGLMVLRSDIFDKIPHGFCSIEKDVVFKLIDQEDIFGYLSRDYIKDFGTPERLESVRSRFA